MANREGIVGGDGAGFILLPHVKQRDASICRGRKRRRRVAHIDPAGTWTLPFGVRFSYNWMTSQGKRERRSFLGELTPLDGHGGVGGKARGNTGPGTLGFLLGDGGFLGLWLPVSSGKIVSLGHDASSISRRMGEHF